MKHIFTLLSISIVFSIYSQASAQSLDWRQMNSSLTTYTQHPSGANTLFAGDQAGLIRKSTDKGATWKLVSTQSESAILDIKFLNNNVGFATVNEPGLFLMTSDGGNTWKRKILTDTNNAKQPYLQYLKRIVLVDNSTVMFDLYSHPISTSSAAEVVIIKDGGQTFGLLKAPGNVYHVAGDTLLAFGRELSNFTYKITIYRSVDKGQSWSIYKLSPTGLGNLNNEGVNFVFFLSSKVFYLTANRTYSSDRQLYKTTDGGLTFTIVPTPVNNKFAGIFFKNEMEGVVIMDNNFTYHTSNGGTNWTRSLKDVQIPLYSLGNDQLMANLNGTSTISSDFGKTWTQQSSEVYNPGQGSATNLFLNVVNDSLTFALLGRSSSTLGFKLVKTTNGGLTWQTTTIENLANAKPIHVISADTFFHIGSGYQGTSGGYMKIKFTTDGGKTSTELYTGEYQEYPKELVFIDKLNAVTYADYYAPNISSDGGKTWTRVTVTKNYAGTPVKMVFPGLNTWYVLASDNKVYKSTDKGVTWNDINGTLVFSSGGLECTTGIYFINETTGFVYGCKGKLYKTSNGGDTWENLKPSLPTLIVNNNLNSLMFQDRDTGFTVDPNSNGQRVVMKAVDEGNTWFHYTGVQNYLGVSVIDFGTEKSGAMIGNTGNYNKYFGNLVFNTDSVKLPKSVLGLGLSSEDHSYLTIFPNPAKDNITIFLSNNAEIISVRMSDITGSSILTNNLQNLNSRAVINTQHLPTGIYIVEIETIKGLIKEKVVINR